MSSNAATPTITPAVNTSLTTNNKINKTSGDIEGKDKIVVDFIKVEDTDEVLSLLKTFFFKVSNCVRRWMDDEVIMIFLLLLELISFFPILFIQL